MKPFLFYILIFFFFLILNLKACVLLAPLPGIEPAPPALEGRRKQNQNQVPGAKLLLGLAPHHAAVSL